MKKIVFLTFFLSAALLGMSQRVVKEKVKEDKGSVVMMETDRGKIVLLLYYDTPRHRENFLKLASEGVYKGLLFHRVIDGFMIQGGDPESRDAEPGKLLGEGSLGYNIPAEIMPGLFHKRGALCAAREGDDVNPKKESSASQFYIVQGKVWTLEELKKIGMQYKKSFTPEQIKAYSTIGGAPHLDGDYTVFGEVLEGMEVVDKIASAPRDKNDRPLEDVHILRIEILKK